MHELPVNDDWRNRNERFREDYGLDEADGMFQGLRSVMYLYGAVAVIGLVVWGISRLR